MEMNLSVSFTWHLMDPITRLLELWLFNIVSYECSKEIFCEINYTSLSITQFKFKLL